MENTFDRERIAALTYKSLNGTLSPEEEASLEAWKDLQPGNRALFNELTDPEHMRRELQQLAAVEAAIERKLGLVEEGVPVRPLRRTYFRWGWAAAILVLLATGTYIWIRPAKAPIAEVIKPGINKAILTLADGSMVTLDSTGNQVILQGQAAVHQQGGHLSYEVKDPGGAASFNTLSTPRGGQFKVSLPDGSVAWLNAASSIRFPVVFIGKERLVEITGEVFLDVAKNAQMPFRVTTNNSTEINVLGTQFNINAYPEHTFVSTTLIEGRVSVSRNGRQSVLSPGEQAVTDTDIRILKDADINKVMAWKNGMFNFEDVSLQDAMQEIERWYDITVVYENGIPDMPFSGKISRDISLNDLIKVLSGTDLKLRLEPGRKLIITK